MIAGVAARSAAAGSETEHVLVTVHVRCAAGAAEALAAMLEAATSL